VTSLNIGEVLIVCPGTFCTQFCGSQSGSRSKVLEIECLKFHTFIS